MLRTVILRVAACAALLVAVGSAAAVQAQNLPVGGHVDLKKSDNSVTPVAGALVEVYRMDIKASLPAAKTNKRGDFAFAGLPLGASFVISVSAPGASPSVIRNVKAGMEKLAVTLYEGDGKRFTEDEVRASANASAAKASDAPAEATEDQKKAALEYDKKVAELTAKNKDIESKNTIISQALKEGNDAFNAKNYELAISKYTEGINADPQFVGSAPILLNNKGVALKIVAVDEYNRGVKETDATRKAENLAKAKKDLESALEAYTNSWTILKTAPEPEATAKANFDKAKYDALNGLTDTYRLLVVTKTNVAKAAEAKDAFDSYLALETDPVKKAKAQVTYGDVMLEAGESEKALAAYRVALATSPDNPDALAGAGLSLVNLGYITSDKTQFQEGANLLQKFVSVAPEGHKYKADALALIETLKKEQNVTPQKGAATSKKKN
jgi:tetratricopeptide (TPR) repeat protein